MTDETAKKMVALSTGVYMTTGERAALRCGMGDAAAPVDAIGRQVANESRTRGGRGPITKRGRDLEAFAKRIGDAIWAMRETIEVPQPDRSAG